ncbi:diacylglycerol O-acyltransferase 2B [Rhizoctonia solani 123E]|uniref:Diacylglycerol O-acyltransferase 2B n=1 Tax=Rhizoctonia solani 123E TaxID=1423351 RepID=A0A074S1H9_9AGAM|nr:diacylglycerol O-acyltransferase 2B [Rhizoctonia solani 123E]
MSTPTNTYPAMPTTHSDEPNASPTERDIPVTTTGAEQQADDLGSSGKSSTEALNSGEDARKRLDSNGTDGNPASAAMVDKVTEKIRGQSMVDSVLPATERPESSGQTSHSGSEGDSSDKETSRKRKLSSRSSVATETAARQHLKRPKESDVPEKEEDTEEMATVAPVPKSPKAGQVFGFGAFASNKSPFLSAQNSSSSTPAPAPEGESRTASKTPETPQNNETTDYGTSGKSTAVQDPPTPKRPFGGGFATFASVSPFQSAKPPPSINPTSPARESLAGPVRRSKSPVGKHQAFGQYSTGLSRFGAHTARKTSQDGANQQSEDGAEKAVLGHAEFDDILKTKGDFGTESEDNATRMEMQRIQYNTGEEEDFTLFQTRAKLYTQDEQFAYKERGTGLLKLNVRRSDGEGARIVMRAEGVLRLLLNMALYPGLICELGPDPKFVKVAEITPNERKFHAIKVGNTKLAQELYDHLTENTPTKSIAPSY